MTSWSRQCESNTQPVDYKSTALPIVLCLHVKQSILHRSAIGIERNDIS